ncbi:MAG: hypothetical protein Q9213_000960 [Squamulea squamosa]
MGGFELIISLEYRDKLVVHVLSTYHAPNGTFRLFSSLPCHWSMSLQKSSGTEEEAWLFVAGTDEERSEDFEEEKGKREDYVESLRLFSPDERRCTRNYLKIRNSMAGDVLSRIGSE